MNKFKSIAKIEADVLLIIAISMLIPLAIANIYKETAAVKSFAVAILCCAVLIGIPMFFFKGQTYKFKYRDGFLIVTITWALVCLLGAIPFMCEGVTDNFFVAFFESTSGFTTTGASAFTDVESLPRSIIMWRSITHFIGGMGILVLLSAVLPSWGITGQSLAFTESTGPSSNKFTAKFSETAIKLYRLYLAMTVAEIILLKLGKMSWFDSFVHALSTVATGGFSSYNNGIMHFDSLYIDIVLIVFMLLAGTNFNLFYIAKSRGIKQALKDEEMRFYFLMVGIFTIAIYMVNLFTRSTENTSIVDSLFQTTSIITTTGFATTDYNIWPTLAKLLLFGLFFVGGCAQSTSGGVKSIRILVSMKLIKRSFSLKLHPNRVAQLTLNGKELPSDTVIRITTFMLTYISIMFIGTLMLSLSGNSLTTNISASLSCLGNIGPGFDAIGPLSSYASFNGFAKLICSFLMIIGRLEVLTVFTLFSRHYWNSNKVY